MWVVCVFVYTNIAQFISLLIHCTTVRIYSKTGCYVEQEFMSNKRHPLSFRYFRKYTREKSQLTYTHIRVILSNNFLYVSNVIFNCQHVNESCPSNYVFIAFNIIVLINSAFHSRKWQTQNRTVMIMMTTNFYAIASRLFKISQLDSLSTEYEQ